MHNSTSFFLRPRQQRKRRDGNLDSSQTVTDLSTAWRQYACMVESQASDQTPLLMLYGGTNQKQKDPLKIAADGLSDLQIYSLKDNRWYEPKTANAPQKGPVLPGCGASSGRIWAYDTHYGTPHRQSTAVSLLDSVHWSWSAPTEQGQLPVVRFGAAFANTGQSFYMHGGVPLDGTTNKAGDPPSIANNMDILDPTRLSWSYASNGPARKYHTLCYMQSIDTLVLFGGSDQNIASYNDVKTFSVKDRTWGYSISTEGSPPSERILHTAVCAKDTMYVFGGKHSMKDDPSDSSVWMLKAHGPANFTWSQAPISGSSQQKGPSARAGHSAEHYNNRMYIFGGLGASGKDHTMYSLDLNKWQWSQENAGGGSDGNGSNGSNTRVLIAAIVSSVLGVLVIGIASWVFYRWNRRKGSVAENGDEAKDRPITPFSRLFGKKRRDSTQNDGTAEDNPENIDRDPVEANTWLPSPHPNPTLESINSYDNSTSLPPIPQQLQQQDSERRQYDRNSQVISDILASGQPIPAWLREAAKATSTQPSKPLGRTLTVKNTDACTDPDDGSSEHGSDTQTAPSYGPIRYIDEPQWSSVDSITQPLAPPIPPNMNSIYNELESNGIVVGHASPPVPSTAMLHRGDIISPLDRLASYLSFEPQQPSDHEEEPAIHSAIPAANHNR